MYKLPTLNIMYIDFHETHIGNFEAGTGKEFLIINMLSIENQGYRRIAIKPENFKLSYNDAEFPYVKKMTDILKDRLKPVVVYHGKRTTGWLVFEVPRYTFDFEIIYDRTSIYSENLWKKWAQTLVEGGKIITKYFTSKSKDIIDY